MRKISLLSFAAVVFALLTAAAPDPAHAYAERTLSQMSPSEKIGQLIIARAPAGTEISAEFEGLLTDYKPGGFCLFQQNVASAAQVRKLTEDLQERSAIPLFIAIDEEGGRVSRLNKLYEEEIPAAYKLAQSGADAVFEAYKTIGERLFSLGVNVDFAPVADIWSNDANRVIGDRAFAKDAETVSEMVEAALRGLDETPGVLSVIKHFPGHGDTA
ncbi:MAG: hypothetical protein LBR83_00880, partial [Clostridiales bacterium]|nr:hypothetical protein [Clostridiales bacterium]